MPHLPNLVTVRSRDPAANQPAWAVRRTDPTGRLAGSATRACVLQVRGHLRARRAPLAPAGLPGHDSRRAGIALAVGRALLVRGPLPRPPGRGQREGLLLTAPAGAVSSPPTAQSRSGAAATHATMRTGRRVGGGVRA